MKTGTLMSASAILLAALIGSVYGQRITTIQLDGVQYFISRMNPYSPELNFFLAYQYCRSLGLQLTSFETREKADAITTYLKNAGHNKYDFWTSGNRLGTDMMLWMSTGLPFNATFDYMHNPPNSDVVTSTGPGETLDPSAPSEQQEESEGRSDDGASNGCVVLKAPDHRWATDDCTAVKDFICEQTRCYYYNYGSIPVSTSQGGQKNKFPPAKLPTTPTEAPISSTTAVPTTASTLIPTKSEILQSKLASSSAEPVAITNPPSITETSLPPLLNITVKRGLNLRASTTPKAPSPSTPSFTTTTRPRSPPPTPSTPLLVSAHIFSRDKTHKLNEAPMKDVVDHNKHIARTYEGKNSNANVVYVKAVGAKNGQAGWSLAYVSKDNSTKVDDTLIDSRPIKQATATTTQETEVNTDKVVEPTTDD